MREWYEDQLELHPESEVFYKGLLDNGGPQRVGSNAWQRKYPPYWMVGDDKFWSEAEAKEHMEREREKYIETLPDYHPVWDCQKCGQKYHHSSQEHIRFNPADFVVPKEFHYFGPQTEDRYSFRRDTNEDGYTIVNSYYRTFFRVEEAVDRLVRRCSCGHSQTTKTKEQTK